MITLSTLIILLAIIANIKVYKNNPEEFNPIECKFGLYMFWFISNIIGISLLILLIIKYLP